MRDVVSEEWHPFAMAYRGEDGALVFAIYAQEARDIGFDAASGGLAFEMLLHAEQADSEVIAVAGIWHSTSDNYKEYWRLQGAGLSQEQAALGTFTGRQADHHGFSRVVSVEDGGVPVRVRFERGA